MSVNQSEHGGWYYLHTNGQLIWKKFEPESDSPFVTKVWEAPDLYRETIWTIVLEATALGMSESEVRRIADKQRMTMEDCAEMLARIIHPTPLMTVGLKRFARLVYDVDKAKLFQECVRICKQKGDASDGEKASESESD